MASDYGLNFGFRRSHEGISVREGRQKTPVGSAIRQGALVTIDNANPGRLAVAVANAPGETGVTGLLVSEEFDASIYTGGYRTSLDYGIAKADRLAVILSGAGTKFWLRNTAGQTRADGRVISAVTMFTGPVAQGDLLAWDGSKYVVTTTKSQAVARCTLSNGSDYLEAVLSA